MVKLVDKVIIANRKALTAKYQAAGAALVEAAVKRLIAADAKRGLVGKIVYIDEAAQMKPFKAKRVANARDERGAKAAVDAIYAKWGPDYVALLDGPDVIPHILLKPIAGLENDDPNIPSDLPYATNAGWSRNASKFLSVTRVVGRIPAAEGSTSPDALIKILDAAAANVPAPASKYASYFSVSAQVWSESTALSLVNIFGSADDMFACPDAAQPAIDPNLRRLTHFINCHGADVSDEFYGQRGAAFPVALESSALAPNVRPGAVVAAECCYGAQLYDFALAGIDPPIGMSYMANGALGFLGSTNIAYGPADSNGQADLLTQYFLQQVLTGASLGRALLQARQKFIRSEVMASPANLKTIAQFILLGDPSVQPCAAVAPAKGESKVALAEAKSMDAGSQRKARRLFLHSEGMAVAATASRPGAVSRRPSKLSQHVSELASRHGFSEKGVAVVEAIGSSFLGEAMKQLDLERKVAVLVERREEPDAAHLPSIRLFVAHIVGGKIIRVETAERR